MEVGIWERANERKIVFPVEERELSLARGRYLDTARNPWSSFGEWEAVVPGGVRKVTMVTYGVQIRHARWPGRLVPGCGCAFICIRTKSTTAYT
jgi:hypothetical protein